MDYDRALAESKRRPLRVSYIKLRERHQHYIQVMKTGRRLEVIGSHGRKTGVMYLPVVPPEEG